jgi:hypothetical protein
MLNQTDQWPKSAGFFLSWGGHPPIARRQSICFHWFAWWWWLQIRPNKGLVAKLARINELGPEVGWALVLFNLLVLF